MYLPILHRPGVELCCKLQEQLHCVTEPLADVRVIQSKLLQKYFKTN